jgi:hypothetical protein
VNFADKDTLTGGDTVTGRLERRAKRERHVRDQAMAAIADGAEAARSLRAEAVSRGGFPDVEAARAALANRPLFAPPVQQWANRSAYARPADAVEPSPATAAPRTAMSAYLPQLSISIGNLVEFLTYRFLIPIAFIWYMAN